MPRSSAGRSPIASAKVAYAWPPSSCRMSRARRARSIAALRSGVGALDARRAVADELWASVILDLGRELTRACEGVRAPARGDAKRDGARRRADVDFLRDDFGMTSSSQTERDEERG